MFDHTRQFELLVKPMNRSPADEYIHEGNVWIEGREGSNYVLEVRNHTNQDVAAIVSVDGLDVIDGKPAGLESSGYIISARQSIEIPGWRLNNQQVAKFFFSRSKNSYVSQIGGSVTNTGVIGAMFFSKKYVPPPMFQSWSASGYREVLDSFPLNSASASASAASVNVASVNTRGLDKGIGTGFGKVQTHVSNEVKFEKANPNYPDAMLCIYYNTAKNLEKMGIQLRRKHDVTYMAKPFPAMKSNCKPPPGWQP